MSVVQPQVNVFPHDEWEDLDIERGVFKAPAAPQPTDSAVVGAEVVWCCLRLEQA